MKSVHTLIAVIGLELLLLVTLTLCSASQSTCPGKTFPRKRTLVNAKVEKLCQKSDKNTFENVLLRPIMRVRVVDTPAHAAVREHIESTMQGFGWHMEEDTFEDSTPYGTKTFTNIIFTQNIHAPKRVILACHYDSKYFSNVEFIGMTDSAVPCAMMLDLARTLNSSLARSASANSEYSLQFIFFDGEEAFAHWTSTDSIYGARHLAQQMATRITSVQRELTESDLDRISVFVLLDLIGAANPTFKCFFECTRPLFEQLQKIERRLAKLKQLTPSHQFSDKNNRYFKNDQNSATVEDDHKPFLQAGVPVLHLIAYPFPWVWHRREDNAQYFDYDSVDNLNKILRVWVAETLGLSP